MSKAPTRIRRTLPLLHALTLLAASGCAVTSDHPLVELADSEPIPVYLLGSWDYVEVAGLNAEGHVGGVVLDRNSDGSLKIVVTDDSGSNESSASLATVNDRRILSLAPNGVETTWDFALLSFNEPSQELTFTLLGHPEVIRDIRQGLVPGEVYQYDQHELAHLNASPEQLRTYFAAHPDAFSKRIAVLRKRSA